MLSAEAVLSKANDYDLSRRAAEERGDEKQALIFAAVALALYELVQLDDGEGREAA